MRKRFRILLAIGIIAIVGCFVWNAVLPKEPSYQGKRLSEWLDEYNRAGAMDKTAPVSEAIRAMGTNTLPFLLAHIKHSDSSLKQKFVYLLAKQHWVKLPFYGTDPYRSTSILALSALGSNAAPLCPELLKFFDGPGINWYGSVSLLAIGPASIPTFAKVCQNTNEYVRTRAISMIATLKVMPPPYVSWGWQKAPINGQPMFSVGYAAPQNVVEEIIKLLDYPHAAVRRASVDALAQYVKPPYQQIAKSAVKQLLKALNDPDAEVRLSAGKTLKAIDPIAAAEAGVK